MMYNKFIVENIPFKKEKYYTYFKTSQPFKN
jgi:hypothetical protein